MPVISRFFGIVIYMYWRDHTPPHFHAKYQDEEVAIEIESGIITGRLAPKAIALIQEWRLLRQAELMADWELARQKRSLHRIAPLE
jgi:hypothetical protein